MQPNNQILTVAQMVVCEQALMAAGETTRTLMQTAGRGAAEWVWRLSAGRRVTVLCGPGNNGGDGYVIAEALRARGGDVAVIAPYEPGTDAARNARSAYGGEIAAGYTERGGDVFVDCLFGSGLARPLQPSALNLLKSLAESHNHKIAIDLPSGIESDSGRLLNNGLPMYDLTLALGAWKYAHWLMPASASMGVCRLVPIGVAAMSGAAQLIAAPQLQVPAVQAHKYARGLAAVIGGEIPGASLLACAAAMRGGAGYVKLLAENCPAHSPAELVIDRQDLPIALEDPRIDALLIGPGLGRSAKAREQLLCALVHDCGAVLDADALVVLRPAMLEGRTAPLVATPHEGELARLSDTFGVDAKSKLAVARDLAAASNMVIVAKGPDTVVAAPDGQIAIARPASSWLSVAGTGDVLAGLVTSRLAIGAEPFTAACEAVWLHGEAARQAGPVFTAGELVNWLAAAYGAAL